MEKVLAYNITDETLAAVYKICSQMRIGIIKVGQDEMTTMLQDVLGNKLYKPSGSIANAAAGASAGSCGNGTDIGEPRESMLVMCNLTEKHMDKLLAALRLGGLEIDYKAVLTPTNSKWNGAWMLAQMRLEKQQYNNNR